MKRGRRREEEGDEVQRIDDEGRGRKERRENPRVLKYEEKPKKRDARG